MRVLFLLLLVSSQVFAQHSSQPEKESSTDLRSGNVLFSLEDIEDEKTFWLERTPSMDYFLRLKDEDDEKILKISSREAKTLDMEFASKFLKCQYELPPSPEGCKATLRLNMKGEGQNICGKDEKKTQEFTPMLKDLGKRF
jgi:hypothetical protein